MYLFKTQRDNDGGWNPAPECNMEDKKGMSRNMHVLVDVSLAMGSGNIM